LVEVHNMLRFNEPFERQIDKDHYLVCDEIDNEINVKGMGYE